MSPEYASQTINSGRNGPRANSQSNNLLLLKNLQENLRCGLLFFLVFPRSLSTGLAQVFQKYFHIQKVQECFTLPEAHIICAALHWFPSFLTKVTQIHLLGICVPLWTESQCWGFPDVHCVLHPCSCQKIACSIRILRSSINEYTCQLAHLILLFADCQTIFGTTLG